MTQQLMSGTDETHINGQGERLPYRIVLAHPSAGVNWSGGAENLAIELAHRLSSYFEVELLSGAPCGSFSYPVKCIPRTYTANAVRHPLIAPLLKGFTTPEILLEHVSSFFPSLLRLLSKPADLIFPHNDYGGLAMAACVRSLTGIPILFTEHNSLLGRGDDGSLVQNGKCLKRNLRFCPNHLVVFDAATAAFARNLKPTQSISVIPNGVNLDKFTPHGTRLDLGLPKPVVLCVASLNCQNQKRVELAMQAVSRLSGVSLLVCGDGGDRIYFQSLGERLLGKERFAIRTFPFEQMAEVYRSVDVFTLPSIYEPFALVYLEAMASGLPVVATDDQIRQYMIGKGGILCDVTNLDIYATALKHALSGNWSQLARENATRFSWDAMTLRYRDVILETIVQSKKKLPVKTD
ncbi:MAG: glycosyltransferase [Pelatocladus maniniholoensis HA4357-MV3]|jgi:glycosyltransferase involved in cell wall biosynthesis|uniref:Glycosyltransferase n=1 Tax=Pelatocladus maniniholoensis HA4357-MV3 TaxID=1117104 RepID=A0A9E3LTX2_9NOST|nr:glycosyltransferase [Pelatocladus maniniholoensis HA4357-MV3]BAZ66841.1 putative glycosyl transferase [Fischerella sp. NIES-4106]